VLVDDGAAARVRTVWAEVSLVETPSQQPLRIRPATVRDVSIVWALIRGLARYERRSHAVKASAARIRRDGFGRRPYFKTLLCMRGREPIGFALYYFAYSTFRGRPILYLEDLFVVPRHRGRGAGKALLAALARVAVEKRCGSMVWTVLRWNKPAVAFYERLGAGPYGDWDLMRLSGTPLLRLARDVALRNAAARTTGKTRRRARGETRANT